jgi:hypothetical protein
MTTESTESPSSTLKVLLVADEEIRGEDFMTELKRHIEGRSAEVQVFVVAPALADKAIEHEMADFDEAIKEAAERLESVMNELKGVGIEAVGEVGDGDPVVAIGDGVREYEPDEIMVVAHREEDRTYAEKDLWKQIRNEFHQPVVEMIVGLPDKDGEPSEVLDTRYDEGREETEEEVLERTRNFPPVQKRSIAGILVGVFGTIALGLLAVAAGIEVDGNIDGGAAAIVLLAIGAFLLNVAHVIGLVFFQSTRYTGVWEKFMARTSFLYTTAAVIAALIIYFFVVG